MVTLIAEQRPGDAYDAEELRKENALLWEANTHLQQRLAEQEQKVTYLDQKVVDLINQLDFHRDWRKQLDGLPGEVLKSGEKATTTAIYQMIRHGETTPNSDGYYLIEPWRVGKATGYSATSTRGHINNLSDIHEDGKPDKLAIVPLFDKRLVKIPDENVEDGFTEATYLKPLAHLPYPLDYHHVARNLRPIGGAGKGQGRKPRCECGGLLQEKEHIIDRQMYTVCNRCHTKHAFPIQHLNDPLPVTDDNPDPENQLDFDSEDEQNDNQLDTVIPYSFHNQVDFNPGMETEENDNQLDYHSEEEHIPEDPSSPPVMLDASQMEAAECDLLLEIAGPGPEHIEMNTNPELTRKYTTIHRPLHKGDMLAHLRGVRTKGATLRHPFGLARALCFDADNADDWIGLKHNAALLAEASFKPMLEPSPAQEEHVGGGHLWMVFDKLVDAYSAYQTLIDIAPTLAEIEEYWPSGENRIRLPGGKYVRPGYAAWCSLYDAYGNELSHDGAGAASVLLEMQTSAALVKKREEKMELALTQEAAPAKPARGPGGLPGQKGDVLDNVLEEFEYSWEQLADMAGGLDADGFFPAKWRGDGRKPNVKIWWEKDRATDFSRKAWTDCKCMDRHHVWCLLRAGEKWQEFRRLDLDRRCWAYRQRQEVH